MPAARQLRRRRRLNAVVALLTDFGQGDGFVGQVKGAILSINPAARLVDLSHEIPPQDILAAALLLEASYEIFPRGTVFCCVVDPGVGSERLALAVEAGGRFFVAPDNGLLTPIYDAFPVADARVIENPVLRRANVSSTFHGRDLFAIAAARLASGFPFGRVGPAAPPPVSLSLPRPVLEGGCIFGEIIAIDHFGNAASSITARTLAHAVPGSRVLVDGIDFGPVRRFYSEVETGFPIALVNSAGRVEVAINGGSAAAKGLRIGSRIEIL